MAKLIDYKYRKVQGVSERVITLFNKFELIYKKIQQRESNLPIIEMPDDFQGFHFMKLYPYYDRALTRFFRLFKTKYHDLNMIDVGANIGDTMAILKQSFDAPILAIEGDKGFFEYLKINSSKYDNVIIKNVFLSDEDKNLSMKSVTRNGTARLLPSGETISTMTLDSLLSKNTEFSGAKLLKIDTDGLPPRILIQVE